MHENEPATDVPAPAGSRQAVLLRLARWLRVEDVVLAAVGLFGLPLLSRLLGLGTTESASLADSPTPLTGVLGLIAVAGVLACLCTRGAGEPAPIGDGRLTFEGWARFPLLAGVAIVATETLPGIGLDGSPILGITLLVVMISVLGYRWLPIAPIELRRTLVMPMALLATGAFDKMMGSGLSGATLELLTGQAPVEASVFLPLMLGVVAALYTALIAAPRAIADPGATWFTWLIRFLFLLAALVMGNLVFGAA